LDSKQTNHRDKRNSDADFHDLSPGVLGFEKTPLAIGVPKTKT